MMNSVMNIKDGEFTSTIYGLIKDLKYGEAIRILQYQYELNQKNRAALSLLAYCYYHTQDFSAAADFYSQLSHLYPNYQQYKIYHAQSLYNAFRMQDALAVVSTIEDEGMLNECVKLEAAIKYREEDTVNCRILVEQLPEGDEDVDINLACIEYKEGNYDGALDKFKEASSYSGYMPEIAYAIALCYYKKRDYQNALKFINEIIDRGVKDHPEFNVGMVTEGIDVVLVPNSLTLHETALIEAFNLKFAIEYRLKNNKAAQECLTDMPPRNEHDLDPVTLHNQALISVDVGDGFAKLQFLLSQNPFPPETFANLLFLYCKHEYYDLAADVLAENAHLTFKYLTPYQYDYLDAMINLQTSPNDAIAKLEVMENEHLNALRKVAKDVQMRKDARNEDDAEMRQLIEEYDEKLELYLPVLMAHAKVYWDRRNYTAVERLFRGSVDYCREHDTWKLNVAHTIFMQEQKYKEAAGFYEPIVNKNYDNILDVSAIILANLCVCYIMTNQNEEAEELMRKVEREEEEAREQNPNEKYYHISIINLVIGSLYCSKGNFEFGITRVIKALEPQEKKLGVDTWYYAKRCIVATIETMAKHLLVIRDSVIHELLDFLTKCEAHGRNIYTFPEELLDATTESKVKKTVTYEARMLKAVLLMVFDS
ncbi:unnamed protein product [Caenorhabditis bovis]|uniref:Tetratricopeptide repeat protein 30 n=1 Tax=Caenorhabditis bovis TaxID=2654633 RepID=A0A8S1FBL1_9PELO|nr:unnamed protein product [Caenorhabditis bovis]